MMLQFRQDVWSTGMCLKPGPHSITTSDVWCSNTGLQTRHRDPNIARYVVSHRKPLPHLQTDIR